jgi:hypothetical protein
MAPGLAADDPGLVDRIAAQEQVDLRLIWPGA